MAIPGCLRLLHEADAVDDRCVVGAVAAIGAGGLGDQAQVLLPEAS